MEEEKQTPENSSSKASSRFTVRRIPGHIFPLLIILCGAYVSYAYCARYCWDKLPKRKAIPLISVYCSIVIVTIFSWLLTYAWGPGKVVDEDVEVDPPTYMCDPQGYRQYCSMCKRIKPDRAHHSAITGTCIPKMDHYCSWLFTVVGERNYRFFLQTVFYFWILNLYIVVTQVIYAHSPKHISAHNIAVYAVCGMFLGVLTVFLGTHCRYVLKDMTTIEHMNLRRGTLPIFNIEVNCQRVVIRLERTDVASHGPYSRGRYQNWLNTMGPNFIYWFTPLPWHPKRLGLNEQLLSDLKERFLTGKEGYLALLQTGRWAPEHLEPPQITMSVGHGQNRSQTSFLKNVTAPFLTPSVGGSIEEE
jgi:DHHC palmitoyltransferase